MHSAEASRLKHLRRSLKNDNQPWYWFRACNQNQMVDIIISLIRLFPCLALADYTINILSIDSFKIWRHFNRKNMIFSLEYSNGVIAAITWGAKTVAVNIFCDQNTHDLNNKKRS